MPSACCHGATRRPGTTAAARTPPSPPQPPDTRTRKGRPWPPRTRRPKKRTPKMNGDPRGADDSCSPPPSREGGRGGGGYAIWSTAPTNLAERRGDEGEEGRGSRPACAAGRSHCRRRSANATTGRAGNRADGRGVAAALPHPSLRATRRRHPPQPLPPHPLTSYVAYATGGDGAWRPRRRGSAATRCRRSRSCRPRHSRRLRRRSQNAPTVAHRLSRSVAGSAKVAARAAGRRCGAGQAGLARRAAAATRTRGAAARGGGGAATCPFRSGHLPTPVGQPLLPPTALPGCPPPLPSAAPVGVSPFAGGAPPRVAATPPTAAPSPAAATATRSAP